MAPADSIVLPLVRDDLEEQPLVGIAKGQSRFRARSSIFDEKALSELEDAVGEKTVNIVTSPAGFCVQMIVFCVLVSHL